MDLWSYLSEEEKQWGAPLLSRVSKQYRDAGVEVWAWPQDWWWPRGRETDEGQSTGIDGTRHKELSLHYRGKYFQHWIAAGKILIDQGIYTHTSDPEIYRNVDEKVGYSSQSKAHFRTYLQRQKITVSEDDPGVFMKAADKHPIAVSAWRKWRASRYTDFFVEYRKAMEDYMAELKIKEPFRFVIYSTYHRHWESFHGAEDYRTSPPYTITLEDPVDLSSRAFDVIAPMAYPDLYSSAEAPDLLDMTRTWKDTQPLEKLVSGKATVMPLLSSGYPYSYYERDLSPEMLRDQILESIAGGARGFGFWGEGIHDARDMAVVGQLVDQLVPAESVILQGTSYLDEPVNGVAFVKGITAPEGALILVSEYSIKEREITVRSPIPGTVIDLASGKTIAEITSIDGTFTTRLDKTRAKMFMVQKN